MLSSRTSPATWAGSRTSSRSSGSTSATDASVERSNSRPITAAERSVVTRVAGQLLQAPGEHLLHAGRRVLLGDQPAEVAVLAGQPGVLHEVERVAVGALPQRGRLGLGGPVVRHRFEHLGHAAAGSPVSSRRTACRRASASATSASAPVGSGWERQVASTSSGSSVAVSASSRSTRKRGHVGPVQVVEDDQARPFAGRVADGPHQELAGAELGAALGGFVRLAAGMPAPSLSSTCCHGHSGGAPSSCEHRPTSTSTPRARATAASSALSRDLPMPGSPVSTAYVAAPAAAVSSAPSRAARSGSRPTIGQAATGRPRGWAPGPARRRAGRRPGAAACRGDPLELGVLAEHGGLQVAQPGAGSRPSSSARTVRTRLSTSRASACRPARASASARRCQSRSRSGWAAVSASSSAATVPWWPSASSASIRCSSATSRSPSSRARSATACGASRARRTASPARAPGRHRARPPPLRDVAADRGRSDRCQDCRSRCRARTSASRMLGIRCVVGDPERVARGHGDQHGGRGPAFPGRLDGAAQAGHVRLQGRAHPRRWSVAPEQVDDRVDRDRTAAGEGQRGHQRSLLGRPQVDRAPVQLHLDRAEDCHLHLRSIGTPGRRARPLCTPGSRPRHPDPDGPSLTRPTPCVLAPRPVTFLPRRSVNFLRAEE